MGFVKLIEAGKDTPWYVRPGSIDAITDFGHYRMVQINHRHLHTKQTLDEIFDAIKGAEAYDVLGQNPNAFRVPSVWDNCTFTYTVEEPAQYEESITSSTHPDQVEVRSTNEEY